MLEDRDAQKKIMDTLQKIQKISQQTHEKVSCFYWGVIVIGIILTVLRLLGLFLLE
jgi:hypothetical protein